MIDDIFIVSFQRIIVHVSPNNGVLSQNALLKINLYLPLYSLPISNASEAMRSSPIQVEQDFI